MTKFNAKPPKMLKPLNFLSGYFTGH